MEYQVPEVAPVLYPKILVKPLVVPKNEALVVPAPAACPIAGSQ